MNAFFLIAYDDGKVRARAGDPVPVIIPPHRLGVLRKARVIAFRDPLDHDGDGEKGGSLPGPASTAAKGRRRKAK